MTRIAIVGAGHIGGNLARLYAAAGHDVTVSFARDQDKLSALAAQIGATATDPARAVAQAEVVVISVPWAMVDAAIEQAGGPGALAGKLVIDTANQFGRTGGGFGVLDLGESSAAAVNAAKAPQATWVKAFNTLTAGFQASSAGRTGPDRVVIFYATDHDDAAREAERLINDAGFDPVRTGTLARTEVGHQEPKGDLYGEEFHHDDAVTAVGRLRGTPPSGRGRPLANTRTITASRVTGRPQCVPDNPAPSAQPAVGIPPVPMRPCHASPSRTSCRSHARLPARDLSTAAFPKLFSLDVINVTQEHGTAHRLEGRGLA